MSTLLTGVDQAAGSPKLFELSRATRQLAARSPQYSPALTVTALALTDFCVLVAVFFSSVCIWALFRHNFYIGNYVSNWPFMLMVVAIYMASGLYRVVGMNAIEELRQSVVATTFAFLVLAGITFVMHGARW